MNPSPKISAKVAGNTYIVPTALLFDALAVRYSFKTSKN
jgi:hypothetical protein